MTGRDREYESVPARMTAVELINLPARAATDDDASSVYSRSTVMDIAAPQVFLDQPRIFSVDREIAVINGTSIALDLTKPRLQHSKLLPPPSPEERRREMLSYEHENRFYTQCLAHFDRFRQETEQVARLLSAYHFFNGAADPAGDPHLRDCLAAFDDAFRDWSTQVREAQEQYKKFWKTQPVAVWV